MSSVDEFSTKHPHEPDVASVLDAEGRCLVCGCQWRDEQIAALRSALAVQKAKVAMYERWLRDHLPSCSLLVENIVADV